MATLDRPAKAAAVTVREQAWYWGWNGLLIGLWSWLYRPLFAYLGIIFSREDFRTNQLVLAGVLLLIGRQVRKSGWRLRLDAPPQLRPIPLLLALIGSVLYLAVERFPDINTLAASLFGPAELSQLGAAVDVYLTASKYLGQEPYRMPLADVGAAQLEYAGWQNAAALLNQFGQLQVGATYDAILVLTDGTGYELDDSGIDVPIPDAPVWMIHTPYSSMIVLVNEAQQRRLNELESRGDRYEREYDEVGETPANITGVPEPEEWLLLALAAGMLIWYLYSNWRRPSAAGWTGG